MYPQVAVPSYQSAYNSLGSTFDPQTKVVNSQLAALPGQEATQMSSLQQAQANAFKDITSQSNSRGMLFSGFSPANQAIYTGTKYLPAVANLKTSIQNSTNQYQGQLATINADRRNAATTIVSNAQKASQEAAYRNAQLQIAAMKAQNSGSGGMSAYQAYEVGRNQAADAAKAAAQYKLGKFGSGNYKFTGPGGRPISMAQYVQGSGGNASDLLDLLKNGSAYDKNIYNTVNSRINQKVGGKPRVANNSTAILNAIASLDKGNYYGLH